MKLLLKAKFKSLSSVKKIIYGFFWRAYRRLKARYRKWRSERKLRKSFCSNWKQYRRAYDNKINSGTTSVKDFYYGYNYIVAFDDYNHSMYNFRDEYICGSFVKAPDEDIWVMDEAAEWCDKRFFDWRYDFHRVCKDFNGQWFINGIGDRDIVFFAFKHEKDYLHFMLRWS